MDLRKMVQPRNPRSLQRWSLAWYPCSKLLLYLRWVQWPKLQLLKWLFWNSLMNKSQMQQTFTALAAINLIRSYRSLRRASPAQRPVVLLLLPTTDLLSFRHKCSKKDWKCFLSCYLLPSCLSHVFMNASAWIWERRRQLKVFALARQLLH